MSISPNIDRVLLLADVARHGNMSRAAEELGYSVSAVSQQIRKLESEVGQPLVARHSRGISLTDAGQAVVSHAEQIAGRLRSLRASLDDIAGLRAGTLRLGTFPTAGSSLLPPAIRNFRYAHPGVQLSVSSSRRADLLRMLSDREVSLTLLWDYHWSRVSAPELELHELLEDPTALVVSESHPLAHRKRVSMSELRNESWVVRANEHPVIEVLLRAANNAGFQPEIAFAANDYQEAQAMVAVGIGVTLAPRLALTGLRDDVRVIRLGDDVPPRRIIVARNAGQHPTTAESEMMRILSAAASEFRFDGVPT